MLTYRSIINEDHAKIRKVSEKIQNPVPADDLMTLLSLYQYVIQSQDEEMARAKNLRPGVGLAAPQIGINKRMFAIYAHDEGDTFGLIIINPVILNRSKEMVYLNGGEGCLSVKRPTVGVTPRHKKITYEGYIYDPNKQRFTKQRKTLNGYFSIVFQHEYDHLDGKLYIDTMIDEEKALELGINPLWEYETEE